MNQPSTAETDTSARRLSRREWFNFSSPPEPEPVGHWIRVHRSAMACRVEVTLPGDHGHHIEAAREALDDVDRLEDLLSVFRGASEVSEVNRHAADRPVRVGPEVLGLLRLSRALHAASDGAFDVTSMPMSRCWGFTKREGRLPAAKEIERAHAVVGMAQVAVDEDTSTVRFLRRGVELSFNSIGKGYVVDRMAERLRARGVGEALLSAGGSSVRALGGGRDGFAVDLRSARVSDGPLARLRLRDAALGTSGAGEQYFETDARRYGHVIDPRTGWPAQGLLSVSVVTDDAATADALATAFLVGGSALAERYCATHPDTAVLLVDEANPQRVEVHGRHDGLRVEKGA